jgi:hypothetical protein
LTSIREAEISGNVAIGDGAHGGGVAVTVGALDMFWNKFSANVAGGSGSDGGAVYFRGTPRLGSEPRFYRSVLSELRGNEAGGRGGGVFIDTGTYVVPELEVTSSDTVHQNTAGGQGGGVFLATDMPIDLGGTFADNTAGGQGGGAYLDGSGSVEAAQFHVNRATEGGGLFAAPTSGLTVERSTFGGNTASVRGGGIAAGGGGGLDVTNATFSGNAAPRGGGLSLATGPSSLSFVTMADNTAPAGANVATSGSLLETYAALLVQPLGGGANCTGAVSPQGSSFVSDASCGAHPTDTVSAADPQLEPLAMTGVDRGTRLPRPTSPIRSTVATGACTAATDQRGQPRPQGPGCEPGAVEVA